MRNIRPDLKEYIGSAGFLYDTPEEASKLLQQNSLRKCVRQVLSKQKSPAWTIIYVYSKSYGRRHTNNQLSDNSLAATKDSEP
jgi:hypothetical protein